MLLFNLGLLLVCLGFVIVLQLNDPPFVWYYYYVYYIPMIIITSKTNERRELSNFLALNFRFEKYFFVLFFLWAFRADGQLNAKGVG
jgi:hypothetical protein